MKRGILHSRRQHLVVIHHALAYILAVGFSLHTDFQSAYNPPALAGGISVQEVADHC